MDRYEEIIAEDINGIANKELYFDADAIMNESNEVAEKIVSSLLFWACNPTNVSPILTARKCLTQFPVEWISDKIKTVVTTTIDISDDWDYRRLLELSELISNDMLSWSLNLMKDSDDDEIKEAISDFKELLGKN